jgi:thiol-disulfide isomerase/thioredoxin
MGGTETAWELWSKPSAAKGEELAEGRWQEPKKTLPPFELADLSGKTWRLKDLEGKSLLINVWATWCGPCKEELPHLQQLYNKGKDRTDVQVLTAYNFVMSLLDLIGIPQNWVIDPKGAWRWTQLGFVRRRRLGGEHDREIRVAKD